MTRAGPSTPAIDQLAVYETLRAAVLSGHSNGQCGLAILTQNFPTVTHPTAGMPQKTAGF